MSTPVELRNNDELEGALLPTAEPLSDGYTAPASLPCARPVPRATGLRPPPGVQNSEAVAIPSVDTPDDDQNVPVLFHRGTEVGLAQAEEEKARIQRANRQADAVNYHEKSKVYEGNQAALEKQYLEQSGQVQTSEFDEGTRQMITHEDRKPLAPAESKPQGTFGKEYEVKEYNVKEYKSSDTYQFSEYKSIYDR